MKLETWSECGPGGEKRGYSKGIALYDGHLYMCDSGNHRIQVFDCDLNFIRTFVSFGSKREQFYHPFDIDFNHYGNAYITDLHNHRIQVVGVYGQFIHQFSHKEGAGEPLGIYVAGEFVYVSDMNKDDITVYKNTSEYVTSIDSTYKTGKFHGPVAMTSDEKYFYISDELHNRILIFCEFITSQTLSRRKISEKL